MIKWYIAQNRETVLSVIFIYLLLTLAPQINATEL